MKKLLKGLSFAALGAVLLAGCGSGNDNTGDNEGLKKLAIGASNVPHAEILEFAAPLLEEEGIELDITTFNDYVLPNEALEGGDIDANFFQHIPYLEKEIADKGYAFVNAGGIHIEPMGVYSQEYDRLDDLPDGAEIYMSSSVADHGRILMMLEDHGLITLAEGKTINATVDDITHNPKNITFIDRIEPALLPTAYEEEEGDAVVINSNFALDAGLNPLEDSIIIESSGKDNPYINVIAVRSGDENDDRIKKLLEVLTSEDVKNFILEKYDGAVIPVE